MTVALLETTMPIRDNILGKAADRMSGDPKLLLTCAGDIKRVMHAYLTRQANPEEMEALDALASALAAVLVTDQPDESLYVDMALHAATAGELNARRDEDHPLDVAAANASLPAPTPVPIPQVSPPPAPASRPLADRSARVDLGGPVDLDALERTLLQGNGQAPQVIPPAPQVIPPAPPPPAPKPPRDLNLVRHQAPKVDASGEPDMSNWTRDQMSAYYAKNGGK